MAESDPVELLVGELGVLHKGRGLRDPKILEGPCPTVREALGIRDDDDPAEQRRQLMVGLYQASESLAGDLRTVFRHAMAIEPRDDAPVKVGDRLALAGKILDRDARTVRRRLEKARHEVAQNLASRLNRAVSNNRFDRQGWRVDSLRSVLRLDMETPSVTERREIVATDEGLRCVTANMSLPASALAADLPPPEIIAEEGCTVRSSERVSASHWRHELEFPVPLHRGQRHSYSITHIAPSLTVMRPYYALVPFRNVRLFTVQAHFGSPAVARYAWRLDGVPPALLDDLPIAPPDFDTTSSQVVEAEFRQARPGWCYGLQWDLY